MCVAIVIGIVPPLGIIGIASPLMVSGLIFPGSGWWGLSLTITLPSAILLLRWHLLIGLASLALACNYLAQANPPRLVSGWESANTIFDVKDDAFRRLSWVRARVERSSASVIVFPENVIPNWTAATDLFWEETDQLMAKQNRVALIGATVPAATHVRNVLLIRGAETGAFDQRIPVPFGMWQPFQQGGVPINLLGRGSVEIKHRRAAVLVCYEQLITWPWLSSMAKQPSVIVSIANDYWSRRTTLPIYRTAASRSWARLFRLPIVSASNR